MENPRARRRQPVHPVRGEALDHQWEHRRHRHRLGEDDRGYSWLLVEPSTPGFSAHDIKGKFSLRASITSELVLDEVRVARESMLPGVVGLKGPFSCLTQARYGIVWGALGAAMACYHTALEYAKEPQAVRQAARRLPARATEAGAHAHRDHQGTSSSPTGWASSRITARCGPSTCRSPSATTSATPRDRPAGARHPRGQRIVNEYPVIRHMLNLETVNTYEGTYDMHTLIIGRDITGEDAIR